jgi:hypothetical protein
VLDAAVAEDARQDRECVIESATPMKTANAANGTLSPASDW